MAYVIQRGKRFTAYYRRDGKRLSAGTWDSYAQAEASGVRAEVLGVSEPSEADLSLSDYFDKWILTADLMPITKKNYAMTFRTYVRDRLGSNQVTSISTRQIRKLLSDLRLEGVKSATLGQVKACLGSTFASLVESEQIASNPTHGIKIKVSQPDLVSVLEPAEFKKILAHLPTIGQKLLAKMLVLSGARFGEATELRVKDFDFNSGEVFIQRRVSELGKSYNSGERFRVIDATKSGRKRSVALSKALLHEIQDYVLANSLGKDDLLFPISIVLTAGKLEPSREIDTLQPYVAGGKRFKHGTLYSYTHGGCRCQACSQTRRDYESQKAKGKAKGQQTMTDKTSHLPRGVWRNTWNKAIAKSGIGWTPRTHDLRHANATQLLKNGVDVHEVKERLGHQSIKTTERYLHRIRHQQSKAGELANDFME
jgi:integrase